MDRVNAVLWLLLAALVVVVVSVYLGEAAGTEAARGVPASF